jgi:hypothetical protein
MPAEVEALDGKPVRWMFEEAGSADRRSVKFVK